MLRSSTGFAPGQALVRRAGGGQGLLVVHGDEGVEAPVEAGDAIGIGGDEEDEEVVAVNAADDNEDETDSADFFTAPDGLQELPVQGLDLKEYLAELEIRFISQALERHEFVVARAAEVLGLRRTTLVEKMRKYNLGKDE